MTSTSLFGRDRELEILASGLRAGRGVLTISGEGGVGKTTLVEAALGAVGPGRIVRARTWPGGGAPAWWPWRAILRTLAPDGLARLSASDGSEEERFLRFDAIVSTLAAAPPAVLLLEDLHDADLPSLQLLRFVARSADRLPHLLVCTWRPGGPDRGAMLDDIARQGRHLALTGLDRAAIEAMLYAAGVPVEGTAELHARSGGNPFFALELARAGSDGRAASLPRSVRELLLQRVTALSAEVGAHLRAAAVAGRFELRLLAVLCGSSPTEARRALEQATEAGLLVGTEGLPPSWAFAHDLVREAIVAGIAPAGRCALHLRVADALDPQERSEVAHHLVAALPLGEPARALTAVERVVERELDALGWESALAWCEIGLRIAREHGVGRERGIALTLSAAEARLRAGDGEEGRRAALEALVAARELGRPDLLGRAGLVYGLAARFGEVDPVLVAALEGALAGLPDGTALAMRVQARLAAALQPAPDPTRALALARQAVRWALAAEDERLRLQVLDAARPAFRALEPVAERLAIDTECLRLARLHGDRLMELRARERLLVEAWELGDRAAVADHDANLDHLRASLGRPADLAARDLDEASVRALRGEFEQAEAALARAEARTGPTLTSRVARARIAASWGRPDRIEACLRQPWGRAEPFVRAELSCAAGDGPATVEALRAALPTGVQGPLPYMALVMLGEAVARWGDAATARAVYAQMLPFSGLNIGGWGAGSRGEGPFDRLLGLLAAALGRHDDARRHLTAAERSAAALEAGPWLARVRADLAAVLQRDGDPRAATLAHQAEQARRAYGMVLPAAPPVAPAPPAGLPGWGLALGTEVATLPDGDGVRYIAWLVRHPDQEVSALDLMALRRGAEGKPVDTGDAGPQLDERALRAYRRRRVELRAELALARTAGDPGAVSRLAAELAFLEAELGRGAGLGGRTRRAGAATERARVNVRMRIRRALDQVAERSPALAHHLETCLRTGARCVYRPGPGPRVRVTSSPLE